MKASMLIAAVIIMYVVLQFGHFVVWVPLKNGIVIGLVAFFAYKIFKK